MSLQQDQPGPGSSIDESLQRELLQLKDLPTIPRVVQEIWQVLESETSSARNLGEVVERDPGLSAKVLRLANSAYFGLSTPVGEVHSACVVLGFETIKSLAIGVSAVGSLTKTVGSKVDLDAFWRHSVGVGTAGQSLARRIGISGNGSAFCGGILHDVGKLFLATLSPAKYGSMVFENDTESVQEAEERTFGANHLVVGGWIAEHWGFPAEICSAIRHHREPWNAEGDQSWGALMFLADWIARSNGCPSAPGPVRESSEGADSRALEILSVQEGVCTDVATRFAAELDRVESFVALVRT